MEGLDPSVPLENVSDPKGLHIQFYVLSLSKLFKDLGTGMLAFLIPLYIVNLHSPNFDAVPLVVKAGIVATVFGFSNALSQPFLGKFSDRINRRKPFVLVGLGGFTILSAMYANTDVFEIVVLLRMVQGVTVAAMVPAIVAMVTHFSTTHTRGKAIGIYSSLRGFGFGSGSILGGFIVDQYGFTPAFYACAFLGLLSTLLVYFFVNETYDDSGSADQSLQLQDNNSQFVILAIAIFTMMVGIMVIFAFLPEYETKLNTTKLSLSIAVSAYVLVRVLFQTPVGLLSDRFGRKRILALGLLMNVPIVIGLGQVESIDMLIGLRALQGISMAAVETPLMALAVELTGGSAVSSKISMITASQAAGMALGPLLGGILGGYVSFEAPFNICGIMMILSFFMVLIKIKEPKRIPVD
ncbi:MFS transporter [Methanolobus sp. ZRKC3]|uniref:MFS transporter n=1 Tax=Methanolobus sp. ZRKC3 TaxID=3125786 RepID=UPI00324D474A